MERGLIAHNKIQVMCTSTPTAGRNWKRIFLIAETFVIVACVYRLVLRVAWRFDVAWHPHMMTAYRILEPMLSPMIWSFLIAAFFLLFASPFFLRSLRLVALRAIVVGLAGLLFAVLLLLSRR